MTEDEEKELMADVAVLRSNVDTLWADMYNGGKDGVKTVVTQILTRMGEKEKQDAERSKSLDRKLVIFGLALTIIGLFFAYLEYSRALKSGEISFPHIGFNSHAPVLAWRSSPPSDATNGAAYTATLKQ